MTGSTHTLNELRNQIDELDLRLLRLLSARAKTVLEIQEVKRDQGLPPYSAARESEIVRQLRTANEGPLPDEAVEDIFCKILYHSLSSLKTHEW